MDALVFPSNILSNSILKGSCRGQKTRCYNAESDENSEHRKIME
jgi:hypothetical protein